MKTEHHRKVCSVFVLFIIKLFFITTNYTSISAALANATIKEIISEVLNIGGSWDYRSYTRYRHDWDTTVRKYKL